MSDSRRAQQRWDEEESQTHLDKRLEYKILRFCIPWPGRIQDTLEEEAHHGWEVYEKLDLSRYRLCRERKNKRSSYTSGEYRSIVWGWPGVVGGLLIFSPVLSIWIRAFL